MARIERLGLECSEASEYFRYAIRGIFFAGTRNLPASLKLFLLEPAVMTFSNDCWASKKEFDTSGKSPAYRHHRNNGARIEDRWRAFFMTLRAAVQSAGA